MNKRKIAALLLAIALFTYPAPGLSESASMSSLDTAYANGRGIKTILTFVPGQAIEQNPFLSLIKDMFKALRAETYTQSQNGKSLDKFELFLQDKSTLSLTLFRDAGEFNLMSSLLDSQTLSFTQEEINLLSSKLLGSIPATVGDYKLAAAFLKGVVKAFLSNQNFNELFAFDPQSLQKDLMGPLRTWLLKRTASAVIVSGTFPGYGGATVKIEYSVTAKEIAPLLAIFTGWAVKDVNLVRIMKLADFPDDASANTAREEIRKTLTELPDTFLKAAGPLLKDPVTLAVWMDDSGTLKYAELKAKLYPGGENSIATIVAGSLQTIQLENGTSTVYSLDIAPETVKQTGNVKPLIPPNIDSVSLSFSQADIPAETKGDAVINYTQWRFAGTAKGAGMELYGLGAAYSGTTEVSSKAKQNDWTLKINASPYLGANMIMKEKIVLSGAEPPVSGTLDLYSLTGGQPMCTVNFSVSETDKQAWPDIAKDNVHLGKMTAEELKAWWQQTYPGVIQKLTEAVGNLPDSVGTIAQGLLVLLK